MIDCRGRNRWFRLSEAHGYVNGQGEAMVSMRSKRQFRDMPPIYFAGPIDEVLVLLDDLKAQILKDKERIDYLKTRNIGG